MTLTHFSRTKPHSSSNTARRSTRTDRKGSGFSSVETSSPISSIQNTRQTSNQKLLSSDASFSEPTKRYYLSTSSTSPVVASVTAVSLNDKVKSLTDGIYPDTINEIAGDVDNHKDSISSFINLPTESFQDGPNLNTVENNRPSLATRTLVSGSFSLEKERSGDDSTKVGQTLASSNAPLAVPRKSQSVRFSSDAIATRNSRALEPSEAALIGTSQVVSLAGSQELNPSPISVAVPGTYSTISSAWPQQSLEIGTPPDSSVIPAESFTNRYLPFLTIGDQIITAESDGTFIIENQSLIPGGATMTISGTVFSLTTSPFPVVGKSITVLRPGTDLPVFVIETATGPPHTAPQYRLAGETLVPGAPAITISGTPVSLPPGESVVVVGTRTETLTAPSDLAYLILKGLGGNNPSTSTRTSPNSNISDLDVNNNVSSVKDVFTGGSHRHQISWRLSYTVFIAFSLPFWFRRLGFSI